LKLDFAAIVVADRPDVFDAKTKLSAGHHRTGDLPPSAENFLTKRFLTGVRGKMRKKNQRVGGIQANARHVEIWHAF